MNSSDRQFGSARQHLDEEVGDAIRDEMLFGEVGR